ncbi:histidine kinase N-terminal 7TM domain-containing protein [Halalkalibacter oceani]
MLAISFYSLGYGFEIISTSLAQPKFWLNVQYIGIQKCYRLFAMSFS